MPDRMIPVALVLSTWKASYPASKSLSSFGLLELLGFSSLGISYEPVPTQQPPGRLKMCIQQTLEALLKHSALTAANSSNYVIMVPAVLNLELA